MKKIHIVILSLGIFLLTGCGNVYSGATPTNHIVKNIKGDCR